MAEFNETYFERVLFKLVTRDAEVMATCVGKLNPQIFSVSSFEKAVKFFQDFWVKHERLATKEDLKIYTKEDSALHDVLVDAFKRVQDIKVDEVDRRDFYVEAERYIKKRAGLLALQEIVNKYTNSIIDAEEAVKKFEEVAAIKLNQNVGYDIYKDIDRFVESLEDEGGKLPLGWRDIDAVINGGIPSCGKFLGVVSAPTNMGKSIFLGNVAVNAVKQGKSVLLISLEMSEMVYATRIYSALYGMNIAEVPLKRKELRDRIKNSVNSGGMVISEFPPGMMTVDQIDGHINDLKKAGYKFDLVCVDYLTLLAAPSAENSNEAGKIISRKLRALSYKHECPFFTAAQINRDGFGIAPDMKYMAESIAICSEADLILSLFRNEEDVEMSIMRCWVLKSRLGIKDVSVKLYFNTKSLKFEDVDDTAVSTASVPQNKNESAAKTDSKELDNTLNDILNMV